MKKNLYKYLAGNDYPGRGIVLGKSPDGQKAFVAYWIMGRSANSRNRVFVRTDDGIRAQAFDPAAMTAPKGILYNPVRRIGEAWVVSNGDQTAAIRDCFAVGRPWEEALRASTLKRFDDEEDPTGKKWEPSARAATEGGKTLDKEGHLKDSIDYHATSS